MIHCFGDSHAAVFSGFGTKENRKVDTYVNIIPYFIGYVCRNESNEPILAYNFHKAYIPIRNVMIGNNIQPEDKLMFCFGEIDCRVHLQKQSEIQNRSIEDVARECAERYMNNILRFKEYNKKLLIFAPIASTSYESVTFPKYGSCRERNKVTRIFNNELKKLSDDNDIIFVSIFDNLVNEHDVTKMDEYYQDDIHLSQTAMPFIMDKMRNLGVIIKESIRVNLSRVENNNIYLNKTWDSEKYITHLYVNHIFINNDKYELHSNEGYVKMLYNLPPSYFDFCVILEEKEND